MTARARVARSWTQSFCPAETARAAPAIKRRALASRFALSSAERSNELNGRGRCPAPALRIGCRLLEQRRNFFVRPEGGRGKVPGTSIGRELDVVGESSIRGCALAKDEP